MSIVEELFKIADDMKEKASILGDKEFAKPLESLIEFADLARKSWSGSWLGYHSRVYYEGLAEPPLGARFSQMHGLTRTSIINRETIGNWREYQFDDIVNSIYQRAGNPDISTQKETSEAVTKDMEEAQFKALSLLSNVLNSRKDDKFLKDISEKIEGLKVFNAIDFANAIRPSGKIASYDTSAIHAGLFPPPHIFVEATVYEIQHPFKVCDELSKLTRRVASHLQNIERYKKRSERVGTNVFIGHGRSLVWKNLKDFINERIRLPWDEFNRVPVAGFTNITRLSQMLDEAAIAFILMTAEDEMADGKQQARQNVIHEAGLFQGRLGFEKAIILIEEGCEEFSNVQGLGQIRFPKGNISAVFEEIRRVLEREGLINEV